MKSMPRCGCAPLDRYRRMQALPQTASNLVAFPRADKRTAQGAAVKYHRLPESLGQALLRDAAQYPDVRGEAALTFAIARRFRSSPIDLENAGCILLVGPRGAGKSAVAAKIAHAAALM